ncbi:MAG: hypothetical protein AAGJ37_17410 [Pseudomonadota bacterium]
MRYIVSFLLLVVLMMSKSHGQSDPKQDRLQKILNEYNEFVTKDLSEEQKEERLRNHEELSYQFNQVFRSLNWNELSDEQKILYQKQSKIGHLQEIEARDRRPSYLPDTFKIIASEELVSIANKLPPLIEIMESRRQNDIDELVHACDDEETDEVALYLQSDLIDIRIYYADTYDSLYKLANKSEKKALDELEMQIDTVEEKDIALLKEYPKVMESEILSHCYRDKFDAQISEFFKKRNEKAMEAAKNSGAHTIIVKEIELNNKSK